MKIINIPIEPIELRYTIQWNTWFKEAFEEEFVDVITLDDIPSSGTIQHGSFLDVIDTNRYKSFQLLEIIRILESYDDIEPLILFFHDIWFPGLTNIAYIRDGMELHNLRICGCLHSGGYDPHDFIRNKGMTPWSNHVERGWFKGIVDSIYVATQYHKSVVDSYFNLSPQVVEITGFPIFPPVGIENIKKENTLVFPHRLVSEKHPEIFDKLQKLFNKKNRRWNWVKTMEWKFSKQEYYDVLLHSKIAISTADHENWGIGMQEAVFCDVIPIVPNRLSYKELYFGEFKYNSYEELIQLVEQYMKNKPIDLLEQQKKILLEKGKMAIPNIIKNIYNLI